MAGTSPKSYMLDTNILIYLVNNNPASIGEHINRLPTSAQLCMSFVSYGELLKGAELSTKKTKVLQQLDQLTRTIKVNYTVDATLCEHYAQQVSKRKLAGTPIGGNDLWIACHALAQRCVLVTNNVREFERVQGLRLENWVE
jgi:tRNA(fMet)-specific endonuclease VapC